MTTFALRRRVSMSAIGSVIVIGTSPLSPARLGHARYFARVDELAKADAAQPELAEHRSRPTAPLAPGVAPHLELGHSLLLDLECLLGHGLLPLALEREAERGEQGSTFGIGTC